MTAYVVLAGFIVLAIGLGWAFARIGALSFEVKKLAEKIDQVSTSKLGTARKVLPIRNEPERPHAHEVWQGPKEAV